MGKILDVLDEAAYRAFWLYDKAVGNHAKWDAEMRKEPTDPTIIELRKHLKHQEMLRAHPDTVWCCRCMAKREIGVGQQGSGKYLYTHTPATRIDKYNCPYCEECWSIHARELREAMERGKEPKGPVIDVPGQKLARKGSR